MCQRKILSFDELFGESLALAMNRPSPPLPSRTSPPGEGCSSLIPCSKSCPRDLLSAFQNLPGSHQKPKHHSRMGCLQAHTAVGTCWSPCQAATLARTGDLLGAASRLPASWEKSLNHTYKICKPPPSAIASLTLASWCPAGSDWLESKVLWSWMLLLQLLRPMPPGPSHPNLHPSAPTQTLAKPCCAFPLAFQREEVPSPLPAPNQLIPWVFGGE